MSSLWGLTEIVLEGEAANDVYALLSRAKEECASEDRDLGRMFSCSFRIRSTDSHVMCWISDVLNMNTMTAF